MNETRIQNSRGALTLTDEIPNSSPRSPLLAIVAKPSVATVKVKLRRLTTIFGELMPDPTNRESIVVNGFVWEHSPNVTSTDNRFTEQQIKNAGGNPVNLYPAKIYCPTIEK